MKTTQLLSKFKKIGIKSRLILFVIVGINNIACANQKPETTEIENQLYYKISNANQLFWFADQVNSGNSKLNAILTNSIIIEDKEWNAIGLSKKGHHFSGIFNGDGHSIHGINIYKKGTDFDIDSYQGLFGYIFGGTIRNLGVYGDITGHTEVGGIVGYNYCGTIENCYFSGKVTGFSSVGGIVGQNRSDNSLLAIISNCYNTATVTGLYDNVGGIAGLNISNSFSENSIIFECNNSGLICGKDNIGGIAGNNYGTNSIISECFNEGNLLSNGTLKMFIGDIAGKNNGIVTGCSYTYSCNVRYPKLSSSISIIKNKSLKHINFPQYQKPQLLTVVNKDYSYSSLQVHNEGDIYINEKTNIVHLGSIVPKVEVYSINGDQIGVFKDSNSIDMKDIPAGIYTLRITNSKGKVEVESITKS